MLRRNVPGIKLWSRVISMMRMISRGQNLRVLVRAVTTATAIPIRPRNFTLLRPVIVVAAVVTTTTTIRLWRISIISATTVWQMRRRASVRCRRVAINRRCSVRGIVTRSAVHWMIVGGVAGEGAVVVRLVREPAVKWRRVWVVMGMRWMNGRLMDETAADKPLGNVEV